MPKTHHATRTFRLSCGCLRDYPGMAAGKRHEVLCPACDKPAATLYAYPDNRCGVTGIVPTGSGVTRLSCTNFERNKDCAAGVHYDEFMKSRFETQPSLKRGAWGQTGRS